MVQSGKIVVIMGPMFAGKTTKLITEIAKEKRRKKRVVVFKAGFDNRYSAVDVVSHDGMEMPAIVLPDGEQCIPTIKRAAEEYDVIGIDEGQFWNNTDGLAAALNELAFNSKTIYVSILNRDNSGEAFRISKELIPIADRVYCLQSKCAKCGKKTASLTQRIIPVKPGATLADMVGGAEAYQPRCRKCFSRP